MSEQNIGSYKGVMLCNRPNQELPASNKTQPFVSRVKQSEPLGLGGRTKEISRDTKPRPQAILAMHKKWLAMVQQHKQKAEQERAKEHFQKEKKKEKFTRIMEKQRQTLVNDAKSEDSLMGSKRKMIENYDKPRWALTEAASEKADEQEIDQLLSFVDNLDYDQYVEDLEFKMALEIVRDKAREIAKNYPEIEEKHRQETSSERPQTAKSVESKQSDSQARPDHSTLEHKEDWKTQDDRKQCKTNTLAKRVADTVLKEYPFLKSIHSNASIRQMMEMHLQENMGLAAPRISIVKDKASNKDIIDASNLPYLHRNPAV